jgi:hypothetical protein
MKLLKIKFKWNKKQNWEWNPNEFENEIIENNI